MTVFQDSFMGLDLSNKIILLWLSKLVAQQCHWCAQLSMVVPWCQGVFLNEIVINITVHCNK